MLFLKSMRNIAVSVNTWILINWLKCIFSISAKEQIHYNNNAYVLVCNIYFKTQKSDLKYKTFFFFGVKRYELNKQTKKRMAWLHFSITIKKQNYWFIYIFNHILHVEPCVFSVIYIVHFCNQSIMQLLPWLQQVCWPQHKLSAGSSQV